MGTSRSLLSKNISRGKGAGLAGLSSSSNHRTLFLPKYYQSCSSVASRTRTSLRACIDWS